MKLRLDHILLYTIFLFNISCHRKATPSFTLKSSSTSLAQNKEMCIGIKDKCSITLKIDTVQWVTSNGIVFSIKYKNTTDSQILIKTPPNEISVRLLDRTGKDLLFPYIPKELVYMQDAYINYSYSVIKMTINGKKINVDPYSGDKTRLSQKGELVTSYRIDRILMADASKPAATSQLTKLPAGEYILFLNSMLIYPHGCVKTLSIECPIKYQNQ